MAETETFVFRASLRPKIYRAFEISAASSLYTLAQAIVRFFDFDFDHAFGFYSGLKGNIYHSPARYELFVDLGEGARVMHGASSGHASSRPFRSVGAKMRFLFDYGDEWVFLVELVGRKPKEPKVRLPRFLLAAGKSACPICGSRRRAARVRR